MEKDDELMLTARPTVSAPTSKVTIAFPFSQIRTQEPSDELRELARIVVDLADRIAALQPSAQVDELAARSRAVFARLDR
jgi:hypothetical protein